MLKQIIQRVARHSLKPSLLTVQAIRYWGDNPRDNTRDNRSGSRRYQREDTRGFTENSAKVVTMTLDDIEDKVTLADLNPGMRQRLERHDIKELFPVQQACYKLFTEGRGLIVK